jgi:signal transduction histidine kinase
VLADRDKIKQVLLNLVKNGVEALDGPGRVTVSAQAERQGAERCVRVRVTDTGRGIPPEDLARVLEPFYSAKEGGTGLGLPIVQRILQLHGCELNIESRPGSGTTMSFLLPAGATEES